jgi:hypothetical protein
MWGVNERAAGNERTVTDYFDKAAEAYGTIGVAGLKAYAMADLDEMRRSPSEATNQLKPGEVNPNLRTQASEKPLNQ